MADNENIEKIILNLETNFESVLKDAAASYTRFVKSTGQTVRGLGGSFDSLAKQVSSSVDSMFDQTQRNIKSSLGQARGAMKQVGNQGIKVIDTYIDRFDKLTARQRQFIAEAAKLKDHIKKQAGIAAKYEDDPTHPSRKSAEVKLDKAQAQYDALQEKRKAEQKRIVSEFNKMWASVSVAANRALAKQTVTAVDAVKATTKDTIAELNKLENKLKEVDRIQGVTQYKKMGAGMEKQKASLDTALSAQRKRVAESELNMEKSKQALIDQTDEKLKKQARSQLKDSVMALREVRKGYANIQDAVKEYGNQVDKVKAKTNTLARELKTSLAKGISSRSITNELKNLDTQLTEYGRAAGLSLQKGMQSSIQKSGFIEKSLNTKIAKLKEYKQQAEALQATGLVDASGEISKVKSILAQYEKFWARYKQEQKNIQSIMLKKPTFDGTIDLGKLRKQYEKLSKVTKSYGDINSKNFLEINKRVQQSEKIYEQYSRKRKELDKQVKAARKILNDATLAQDNETNKKRIALYEKYIRSLRGKLSQVKGVINKQVVNRSDIQKQFVEIENVAKRTQNVIRRTFANNTFPREEFNRIKQDFRDLQVLTNKLSQKRFINTKHIEEVESKTKALEKATRIYGNRLEHAQKQLAKLNQIQKAGLGTAGIQKQTDALENQISQMRRHYRNLSNEYRRATNEMNQINKKASKSFVRNAWESVRNFRWQVAAVIYLISRAVMTVQRTVLAVLNNIQQFRMDAMSLAASFSMQMIGNISDTYETAYQYARDLMVKLEMQAAKTILTVEDMLMLTKTFAQAGIIPKTDKDIQNIATIGTAIKALTEGMANAGVQMRQELYAIIAGRQRATDQLAMMFKFIGIDIQQVIKDAREEGVNMIDALADALRPFDEMNRRMEKEFGAVINRLKAIWGLIQRIGAEYTLVEISEKLFNLAESIATVTDKGLQLTERGKEIATGLGMAMETVQQVTMTIWGLIKTIVSELSVISSIFTTLFGGLSDNANKFQGEMKLVGVVFEGIMRVLGIIRSWMTVIQALTEGWSTGVRFILSMFKAMGDILYGIATWQMPVIKSGVDQFYAAIKNSDSLTGDFKSKLAEIPQIWKDINKSIENAYKALDKTAKKQTELGKLKTIPHPFSNMAEEMGKLGTKFKELRKAAASDKEKIQVQYEIDVEGLDETKRKLKENIAFLQSAYEAGIGLGAGEQKVLATQIQGFKEYLAQIEYVEKAAAEKRHKALEDLNEKETKAYAQAKRQFNVLMTELYDRPETREDKTNKWKTLMEERIIEMTHTNEIARENADSLMKALDLGFMKRQLQDAREYKEELIELFNTINSHKVMNPYEEINAEMDKLSQKIRANEELSEDDKLLALQGVMNAKKERIELEKINQTREASLKILDAQNAQASRLVNSYSPIKQLEGEVLQLHVEQQKALINYQSQMEEIDAKWKDDAGNWKEGAENAQRYSAALQAEFIQIQKTFEEELWKKQHPLWNDMIEMSKNWADGLSDSLTDLVLDFENFGESMKSLWESIVRDMVKASIKRLVVDNLMDKLGSGAGTATMNAPPTNIEQVGSAAVALGKIGEKGREKSIIENKSGLGNTFSNPVPVIIVGYTENTRAMMAAQQTKVTEAVKESTAVIEENVGETNSRLKNGFSEVFGWIGKVVTTLASGVVQGGKDLFGGIFDFVGGLFGGGSGSGGGGGGGSDIMGYVKTALGFVTSYFGGGSGLGGGFSLFDTGGMITEPVVGKGMKTGKTYEFAKNGKSEMVTPVSEWFERAKDMGGSSQQVIFQMPLNLNAIDTRTGVEFIMQNQSVIEASIAKSFRNNKNIRSMVRRGM